MACGQDEHHRSELGAAYVHLLGLYLGDGSISKHPRGVFRLRVFLDKKYPQIVEECVESMQTTVPDNKVHVLLTPSNCYSVSSYTRSWPCLSFPSTGLARSTLARSSSRTGNSGSPSAGQSTS